MKFEKIVGIVLLVIALLGFADATYLTIQHSFGAIPPCFVTTGCETVLTSKWSAIGGIPVSVHGMVYYAIISALAIWFLVSKKMKILKIAAWATFLGFFASLWFVSLQIFIIKSFCFYCLLSAITSTALFIVGTIFIFKQKSVPPLQNPS